MDLPKHQSRQTICSFAWISLQFLNCHLRNNMIGISEYDKNFIKELSKHNFCSINKSDGSSSINWFNYICNMRLLCKKRFILNTHMHQKICSHTNKLFNVWKRFAARDNELFHLHPNSDKNITDAKRIGISSQHSCCTHTTTHTHPANYAMWHGMIKLHANLMKTELENFPFDAIWTRSPQSGTQNITKLYSLRGISFHSCSSSCCHAGWRCHTFTFLK